MIALVRNDATDTQLSQLVRWIEGRGLQAHVSRGDDVTIVGLVGDTSRVDPFLLESMGIIERVQRVSEPFKLASRTLHPADTVVDCGHGVRVGGGALNVVADICPTAASGLADLARNARACGATMLRGSAYGPMTSPYDACGLNERGLDLLLAVGSELGMPVISEVMDARDVDRIVDRGVDVMQVGARNSQNLSLLRELGRTNVPVLLRRGVASTVDELLMAAEHVMGEGNGNVILCERGIRSFETRTRSTFDVAAITVLRHLTHLPIMADPCRATGHARYVPAVACAAVAAGADGIEMELCDDPASSSTRGTQALTPDQFAEVVQRAMLVRAAIASFEGGVRT